MKEYFKKRLMQTSEPFDSATQAMDVAIAWGGAKYCEFTCVTADNRVISIWEYNDVEPDKPVFNGQQRILVPTFEEVV
ncbi:hypothetical protein QE342_gp093 [Pseudomonas phage vB_PaeS_B8]|nr:hypothetical protein PJG4_135 [Pseudomonas phage JG004]YP_008857121.1 hypothetical protein X831_gp081 [Pseudomonas phage PAK_P2]YP_009187019.1 hypothetical protein AU075_gp091 [Pseudomonas phage C11]YP_009224822.1 hypothetical protein PaoP5_132 [Pseudomonas phage PaoP5]YP_009287341.1 hypothetical protein BIZ94_gp045 [Pseudomonas phage vB_PaeM_MAG1]YP_009291111.1 hypothetical protein BI047_gp146 [Pseudomonas phage phiMK]YP_009597964.1 hypothetical protein FDH20_gp039 [Pseudomonas phage PA10